MKTHKALCAHDFNEGEMIGLVGREVSIKEGCLCYFMDKLDRLNSAHKYIPRKHPMEGIRDLSFLRYL